MLSSSSWAGTTNPLLELLLQWFEIIFRYTQTLSFSKRTSPPPHLASCFTAAGKATLQLHSSLRSEGQLSVQDFTSSFNKEWDEVCRKKWKGFKRTTETINGEKYERICSQSESTTSWLHVSYSPPTQTATISSCFLWFTCLIVCRSTNDAVGWHFSEHVSLQLLAP